MGQEKQMTENNLAAKLKGNLQQKLTIVWDELQPWQQDNHYIKSGYRPASGSYLKSASSLTYMHNETVNIFSHLIGSIVFAIGSLFVFNALKDRYTAATQQDVFVFGCFFVGAVACLGMSAAYHTFSNHSELVSKFGNKLDYLGIVCLIWGSFIPSIYYGFTCDPTLISSYWAMITTIGAGCAVVCLSPKFATPKWRPFRAAMFVAMGLSAAWPVLHGIRLYGIQRMIDLISLRWLILQGFLYILGAGIYAARVPEKWSPGKHDLIGSSHQIFHLLVLAAAFSHLTGLINAFDFHHSHYRSDVCPLGLG